MGPRKYKRRRKLKPEELERLRVEEPSSKRETRKRKHSEKDDLYSNDTFDDTDSYMLHENYGFIKQNSTTDDVLKPFETRRNRSKQFETARNSSTTTTTTIETITADDDDIIIASPEVATTSTNTKARMIHTKKKVVPAKDGRSKGKTMITQTTPSPAEKTKSMKSKTKIAKKQTKRSTTTANKSLTNGSVKSEKSVNYDIEHEISQNNLLLELSKKSVHYSPDVVSDLEEILRSPIKSREERSSFSQADILGDITLSPNYFDQTPPETTHQRNTRSSKRLSNRNLTKELNQAAVQITPPLSTGGKSTRQRSTVKASSSNLLSAIDNTAIYIKQEKEVSYTLSEEPPTGFTCEMCSAEFSDRAQLLVHVPIHI